MNTIGEIIKSRRNELGLTLEEVGNFVGVSKSTVKKWESGFISDMRRDKIAALSEILKINPLAFIGGGNNLSNQNGDLTSHERAVINAYRTNPSMQDAVDRLLQIQPETKKTEDFGKLKKEAEMIKRELERINKARVKEK